MPNHPGDIMYPYRLILGGGGGGGGGGGPASLFSKDLIMQFDRTCVCTRYHSYFQNRGWLSNHRIIDYFCQYLEYRISFVDYVNKHQNANCLCKKKKKCEASPHAHHWRSKCESGTKYVGVEVKSSRFWYIFRRLDPFAKNAPTSS